MDGLAPINEVDLNKHKNKSKMKVIGLLAVKLLAIIAANLAFVWTIVEFILYLAKDRKFNWWSVRAFAISVVVAIALVLIASVWKVKEDIRSSAEYKRHLDKKPKSRWQQRLDELQRQ